MQVQPDTAGEDKQFGCHWPGRDWPASTAGEPKLCLIAVNPSVPVPDWNVFLYHFHCREEKGIWSLAEEADLGLARIFLPRATEVECSLGPAFGYLIYRMPAALQEHPALG